MFYRHIRFSTLEVFTVTTVVGALIASAVFEGQHINVMLVAAGVCFWACLIVAVVGRSEAQKFSAGFCLSLALYAVILCWAGRSELDFSTAKLPTSTCSLSIYEAIVKREYRDPLTDKTLPNYDPSVTETRNGIPVIGVAPLVFETPTREHFMTAIHLFWAMSIGYVGGKFAIVWSRADIACHIEKT